MGIVNLYLVRRFQNSQAERRRLTDAQRILPNLLIRYCYTLRGICRRPPKSIKISGRKYHYPLCLSSRYRSESHSEDRAFSIIARGPAAAEATFYQHWYSVKVLQKNSYIIPRTIIRVNPLAVYSWRLPKISCEIYARSQRTAIIRCISLIE